MEKVEAWKQALKSIVFSLLHIYDKAQDSGQKIVSLEGKIHGVFNMKVLQSLYCS